MEKNDYPSLYSRKIKATPSKRIKIRKEILIPTASIYDDLNESITKTIPNNKNVEKNWITIFGFSCTETLNLVKYEIKKLVKESEDENQDYNTNDLFSSSEKSKKVIEEPFTVLNIGKNWINIELSKEELYNKVISRLNGKIFNEEMVGCYRRFENVKKEELVERKMGCFTRLLIYLFGGRKNINIKN